MFSLLLSRFLLFLMGIVGHSPRCLFLFFDGTRWRRADPFEVLRTYLTHPKFDWDETLNQMKGATAVIELTVVKQVADATREVFKIKPFAEGGLTDEECLNLFIRFRDYTGDVKKNGKLFPISQDSQESESDVWADLPNPTKPGGGYGSTVTEPSPAQPGLPVAPTSAN